MYINFKLSFTFCLVTELISEFPNPSTMYLYKTIMTIRTLAYVSFTNLAQMEPKNNLTLSSLKTHEG